MRALRKNSRIITFAAAYFALSLGSAYFLRFSLGSIEDYYFICNEAYLHPVTDIIPVLASWLVTRILLWTAEYRYLDLFLRKNAPYYMVRGLSIKRIMFQMDTKLLACALASSIADLAVCVLFHQGDFSKIAAVWVMYMILQFLSIRVLTMLSLTALGKRSLPLFIVLSLFAVIGFRFEVCRSSCLWRDVLNLPPAVAGILSVMAITGICSALLIRHKEF